ncbi:jg22882 [Pararge aegeria aegeria]|uniref:Jg22882 protein n=1 Tax=Pararge aegeria aegeria TaxID=348720 RepID=A0A8S4RYG2_9NEOP|nr:jg22882 [Pararge aegeria aegeria]
MAGGGHRAVGGAAGGAQGAEVPRSGAHDDRARPPEPVAPHSAGGRTHVELRAEGAFAMIMLFKGNSSRLEHLIEKIQANKENHDVTTEDLKQALGSVGSVGSVGSTGGSSWPSSTPEPSPSPSSTPTSHDAVDAEADADADPPFTLGATEHTPYKCKFCDKAFPRLSYLKKHEQV